MPCTLKEGGNRSTSLSEGGSHFQRKRLTDTLEISFLYISPSPFISFMKRMTLGQRVVAKFRTYSGWMFVTSCYCTWPCQRTKSSFRCVPLTSRAISEMWTASKKLAVSHKCMGDNWAGKQRNLSLQFTIIYRNPRPWFISEVSWMLYHWAALFNNNYYTYSGCGVK